MAANPAKPPLPRRTPQATAPDRTADTLVPRPVSSLPTRSRRPSKHVTRWQQR
ncbi:hypothetical protein [Streptomyces niveus]|uniref:hypothetical protein n=1 Tax=Streptomyces niveus TaxID=193462 RepID=UPI003669C8DD